MTVGRALQIYHDRRFMALVENAPPHWVQAKTLDSVGVYDYDGQMSGPFTAHPKVWFSWRVLLADVFCF